MSFYRYEVGDKVLVKPILEYNIGVDVNSYKMKSGPRSGGWVRCDKQREFQGKVVTISKLDGGYRIVEDGGKSYFVDEMFVGKVNDDECYCETLL